MIYIERFNGHYHDRHISKWLKYRSIYKSSLVSELPALGYIAYEDELPVAAGFLRLCEGGFGMIDSLITDPTAPGELRNEALDKITHCILQYAKSNNINNIIAFSRDNNTLTRSLKHGFSLIDDYKVISIKLKE